MKNEEIISLLRLIEKNCGLSESELSVMLNIDVQRINSTIENLKKEGIICGYHALINWDKVTDDDVIALIELRVTPQGGEGYEKIANRIKEYPQIKTLYLMSGDYDFLVMVEGRNLKEIALFVSSKLASLEDVKSTTTHFILSKYKELGFDLGVKKIDRRMVVSL